MNAVLKKTSLEDTTALALSPFPKPAISIVGLGYVGAVSAACLSKTGHQVIGVDIDEMKVGQIANGESPIHEADLEEYLQDGVANGLVSATVDLEQAVIDTDVTFVSVGTPTAADGGCDHTYIVEAARAIGRGLAVKGTYHVVVMRCSIPPGSTLNVMVPEIEAASGLKMGEDFGVCFNPEFLREGTAIADFFAPPKTVIGANDEKAAQIVEDIYRGLEGELLKTTIDVAEMVKYVDNVWHATKVCFANEIGRICKPLAIDSHKVMDIFVKDTKLNLSPYYLKPGFAYGGSCLPKEVRAVSHLADKLNVRTPLVRSLAATNMLQIENAADLVRKSGCRKIGFMGLAFKAGTDDLRESPILEVINALAQEEYDVLAYDPAIKADTRIGAQFNYVANACPHLGPLVEALPQMLCEDPQKVIAECDAIVVTQNTPAIRQLVSSALGRVEIIDLVRIFNEVPTWKGYHGIGW
jgi:GDP-mannose 6-dehydrogenase